MTVRVLTGVTPSAHFIWGTMSAPFVRQSRKAGLKVRKVFTSCLTIML